MEFEVLSTGTSNMKKIANPACPGINGYCPGVNGVCPGVNKFCDSDSNCPNVFPCANPGFGCRSGCGGAKSSNCVAPYSSQ